FETVGFKASDSQNGRQSRTGQMVHRTDSRGLIRMQLQPLIGRDITKRGQLVQAAQGRQALYDIVRQAIGGSPALSSSHGRQMGSGRTSCHVVAAWDDTIL